jgi:hypothetical protein
VPEIAPTDDLDGFDGLSDNNDGNTNEVDTTEERDMSRVDDREPIDGETRQILRLLRIKVVIVLT